MLAHDRIPDDQALVNRCLAEDASAWRIFHDRFRPLLWHHVAKLLGPGNCTRDKVEDILSRIWCSLLTQDRHRLRAYDPSRGTLTTFLCAIARQTVQQRYRAASRRPPRESSLPNNHPGGLNSLTLSPDILHELFVPQLSPQEQLYFTEYLMAPPDTIPSQDLSAVNQRKLKQRVRMKLLAFLGLN